MKLYTSFWQDIWEGIKTFFQSIGNFFMTENEYGLNVLSRIIIALVVLILGIFLIKGLIAILKKASGIKKGMSLDLSAKSFFFETLRIFLYVVLAFAVVAILGFDVTGLAGILSAVTVALGLALQDIIGMFASGILILNTKNIHTGDYIKVVNSLGTEEGTVERISLLYTTLLTINGQKIYIPNNNITKSNLTNYSVYENRRGIILITLTHNSDTELVLKTLKEVADNHIDVLKDPSSFAYINDFNSLGVEYALRFHAKNEKYWDVLFDLRKKMYISIKEKGFEIASVRSLDIQKKD